MLKLVIVLCELIYSVNCFFNYFGNGQPTYYPGQIVLNTQPYFTTEQKPIEVLDYFPKHEPKEIKKIRRKLYLNETYEKYVKTYFERHDGSQADVLNFKFHSLDSDMESLERLKAKVGNQLAVLKRTGDINHFYFLHYQKRSIAKLVKAINSSKIPKLSKIFAPGVFLPKNASSWNKKFDEVFEELKDGEPLVHPELFKKQKSWWLHHRKQICLFKIDQLRNYIRTIDNFFYKNQNVLSVQKWIRDREKLYVRKLSDMFWWLCRRDQYFREEYARLDYDKVWTPWMTTTLPPHLTTFDYFRYNGDFHYLLRRRNKFYARFFKRKKIGLFIKRLATVATSTVPIQGYLMNEMNQEDAGFDQMMAKKKELMVVTKKRKEPMKTFNFQYFGLVKHVGLRTAIATRARKKRYSSIRGYVMYTHKGTVFGRFCGPVALVDELRKFITKLKTPRSKVTKLEIRGEASMVRYPKGMERFYVYKKLFDDQPKGTTTLEDLVKRYKYASFHNEGEESIDRDSREDFDIDQNAVEKIFKRLGGGYGADGLAGNDLIFRKHNLKNDGLYV